MSNKKTMLLVGVEPDSLLNFRGELLKILVNSNLSVTTISRPLDENQKIKLESLGVDNEQVDFSRNGLNPITDVKTFFSLFFAYKKIGPSIVLSYTIKPIIWGGIASRFFKLDFYALITGLGFAFQGDSFKRKLLTKLVVFLYKIALKSSKSVIFQNEDNLNLFVDKGIILRSKTHVVNGSGVDVEKFNVVTFPKGNIHFLCISRLLSEKGLREYAAAARIVKYKFPGVEFDLVGPEDSSPDAILLEEINGWVEYINYKGSTNDVRPHIKACHVYVLPSYHEGLPRSTLEAMSMGRPILTTNAVGCKDTVEDNINGFKVPIKSVDDLAKKMIWFIEHRSQVNKMGLESRRMVEDKFDVHKVNKEMLKIMRIK
jgi:glycosyltransferase involved in cell wall biosynthesis